MNSEQTITGPWCFRLDLQQQGRQRGWFRHRVDLADWRPVKIPHSFEGPPLNLPGVEGCGWYRRVLPGAPAAPNEHWVLRFGAVNYHTEVWVNGRPVGRHDGGYTPFEIDITRALRKQPGQTVVVLVDNLRKPDRCPAVIMAWPNVGGIHRPVTLFKHGGTRLASVRLHDASAGTGPIQVVIDCRVVGRRGATVTCTLIGPYHGRRPVGKLERRTVELDAAGQARLELPAGHRWQPDRPLLYRAVIELRSAGRLVERKEIVTGFRTVATRGKQFLLNGKPCWVQGLNYLFNFPNRGMIVDPVMLERDLRRMKQLGANTIRSHFAMPPRAYELCDELGLMVWHDVPLYWWHNKNVPWGRGELAAIEAMRPQIAELVTYDYNHPSVVLRVLSNECGFYDKRSQAAMRAVCTAAKRLDPTRLHALCAYVQQDEGVDLGADAILCNFYRDHQDKSMGALPREVAPTVRRLRQVARHFPDRPIFVSEVGFEAAPGHHGDLYSSEEFQAAALQEYWKQLTATGLLSGFTFWCWADYRYIVAKPWGDSFRSCSPAAGLFGIVTEDRAYTKRAYATVHRCFCADGATTNGQRAGPVREAQARRTQ